jgi:O-antigen ligase
MHEAAADLRTQAGGDVSIASSSNLRDRLDVWCERAILGLVLGILIFSPLATGAVRPQDFVIVQWLTLGTIVLWGLRFFINPKHRLLWPPMCWAVLLFMAYAVVRYLTADLEYVARHEIVKVLVYGFLFFAILNNLHRRDTTAVIVAALLFIAMAIAGYALYQFVTGSDRVWHFIRPAYAGRGSGTYISPNHMAGYLEMLLPLGMVYTLLGRLRPLTRILAGYASLVIVTGLAVSVSRGAWIATGVALLALFAVLFTQRGYKLPVLAIVVILTGIGFFAVQRSHLSKDRKQALANLRLEQDIRPLIWRAAIDMWRDHPLTGVGPAHFDYRFRAYRPASGYIQGRPDRAHNDYLNTLADWGLIGFTLVAGAWALFGWGVVRSWKYVQRAQNDLTAKRSNRTAVVLGASIGLLAILVHSFVDFNMHIPANAILAVTLLALVAGHFRFATESYWHTVRWPLRIPLMLVLVAGIAYLGLQTNKRTLEVGILAKAERLKPGSTAQTDLYKKAFALEPTNFEAAYAIGEHYRLRAWRGLEGHAALTTNAMAWFTRSMQLNPYDPYGPLRYGMCLDWLGKHDDALPYYERALQLDPNSYYTRAHMGWHYAQLADWPKVLEWMNRSLQMRGDAANTVAWQYIFIAEARIREPAAKVNLSPAK